jgi:hypothetical protein
VGAVVSLGERQCGDAISFKKLKLPWRRVDDTDLRKTSMRRLRTVLAILFGLAGMVALWLFGAWLATFLLH